RRGGIRPHRPRTHPAGARFPARGREARNRLGHERAVRGEQAGGQPRLRDRGPPSCMKPGSSRRPGAAVGTAASDPSGTPPRCIARTTDRSKETLLAPTPNSTSPPRPRRRLELVGTLLAFLALTGLA